MFLLLAGLSYLAASSRGANLHCAELSYSSSFATFEDTKRIERIAVSGVVSAFHVEFSLGDDSFQPILQPSGLPLLLYSSSSHQPVWTHTDLIAKSVRLKRLPEEKEDEEDNGLLLLLTLCDYGPSSLSFDDSPFVVDTAKARLVSMYENELRILFRTFRSSLFFYSSAPQGDLLIAELVHGTVNVIFDFGSLSPSRISAGRALDDGEWHEMKWLHQFDSVQLFIDGVLCNETSPSGLYRKLDLNSQLWIAGRSPDDTLSLPVQSTFRGCLARVQLNSVHLLDFAPPETPRRCHMTRPPSLTLYMNSEATVPFSFLPFSFEFRLVTKSSTFMRMVNAEGVDLVRLSVVNSSILALASNATKHEQMSNPPIIVTDGAWHSFSFKIRASRLEVEVDGKTVLWLEGPEVRSMTIHLASVLLSSEGCYRSTTLDLQSVPTKGKVERGKCEMKDRCTPNPCKNSGRCVQSSLDREECQCEKNYGGIFCHRTTLVRSCEEHFFLKSLARRKPSTKARKVLVDLDAGESLSPVQVECAIRTNEVGEAQVVTISEHDMTVPLRVSGEKRPGEVREDLKYGMDTTQMETLVHSFDLCSQYMRYECKGGARLMTWEEERTPSSWYTSRSDKQGLQWASAPPYSRMCACAVHANCTHNKLCNCDSGEDGVDEGDNTFSQLLPVTSLFIGGTTAASSVQVTVGPLVCQDKLAFEPVTFMDRNARLTGSKSFNGVHFSLSLHIKFTHHHMSLFTWESSDSLHFFHLHISNGILIGEVVVGGESYEVRSKTKANDGLWHRVEWDAHRLGQTLMVDDDEVEESREGKSDLVLPHTFSWTMGSRTGHNGLGFAGVVRNVYLCGDGLPLALSVREDSPQGIVEGEKGRCVSHHCANDGHCVDHYDSYSCDCSKTPFGGEDCSKDHGLWVPAGSSLSIPWQNPSHTSLCHRLSLLTATKNISLIRSRGLFHDASFNLSLTATGRLSVSFFDGLFFKKAETFGPLNVANEIIHDIAFCASLEDFKLTIDGATAFNFSGNFSFFESFNVWHFVDSHFVGCLSRMQIGSSFPLKDPQRSRLKTSGGVLFGHCPSMVLEPPLTTKPPEDQGGLSIGIAATSGAPLASIATIAALSFALILFFILCILICYMRGRPEGVYKTNESGGPSSAALPLHKSSPTRSEEPLVTHPLHPSEKEYFC